MAESATESADEHHGMQLYFVPDKECSDKLKSDYPMKVDQKVNGFRWGGLHMTIGYQHEHGPDPYTIEQATECCSRAASKLKESDFGIKTIRDSLFFSRQFDLFGFDSDALAAAAKASGWKGLRVQDDFFHVTMWWNDEPNAWTKDELADVDTRLRQATWGFIITRWNEEEQKFDFDWDTFVSAAR